MKTSRRAVPPSIVVVLSVGLAATVLGVARGARSQGVRPRPPSSAPSAYDPPRGPGDARPEPEAPAAECAFERRVSCQPFAPVLSAWQPPPFEACPPEMRVTPRHGHVGPAADRARFSVRETRSAWRAGRLECCYVVFEATGCD